MPLKSQSLKKKLDTTFICQNLLSEFTRNQLNNFWIDIKNEYERLSDEALEFLLPFTSMELVERAFSSHIFIENKNRNKLNEASDLRLYLASFEPKILINSKQGR